MRSTELVTGGTQAARGVLAAVLAVGSAAVAHSVGGHHDPHWVVLLLTLAISLPLCVALSAVKLSRARLTAAVLSTQGLLHGLFALFPAASGAGASGLREVGGHHNHHVHHLVIGDAAAQGPGVAPDAAMTASHLFAAVITYTLLRRGELILHALTRLISLRPVLLLCEATPAAPACAPQPTPVRPLPVWRLWISAGPRTLRGPPLGAN